VLSAGCCVQLTGDKNKLSTYFSQINAGLLTLVDLDERWDQYIASGDGDGVRRRLGTVGSKSPLHNIRKVSRQNPKPEVPNLRISRIEKLTPTQDIRKAGHRPAPRASSPKLPG